MAKEPEKEKHDTSSNDYEALRKLVMEKESKNKQIRQNHFSGMYTTMVEVIANSLEDTLIDGLSRSI